MFKLLIGFVCVGLTIGISIPSEPKIPTTCTELKAELKSSKAGYIAEADESKADTKRIQEALSGCKSGEAVKLSKGTGDAFLSGPLNLPSGITLVIDSGVTLYASRNPRDFDSSSGSCGVLSSSSSGCKPLITAKSTSKSGIMGDGVIDGRGGQKMIGGSQTWWELALAAQDQGKDQSCPRLVLVDGGSDFTIYKVRLHNSPNFHFVTSGLSGLVVWGVKVQTPSDAYPSGTHARNTDAFDPNGSNMVFYENYIDTGDDNIAIKGGHSHVTNVLIQDNHFYRGHGMSIGSETDQGVSNVTVKNLSIDGADNGLRIKSDASRGGAVSGITYDNICIRNVDAPLVFDAYYSSSTGSKYPDFHDIHVTNTHILSSGKKNAVFRGYNDKYPLKITLTNVVSDVTLSVTASDAQITEGPGAVTGIPVKADSSKKVTVSGSSGTSSTISCSFPSFPK